MIFYGINPNNNKCQKCMQERECKICINSIQNRCIVCDNDYRLEEKTGICVQKIEREKYCGVGMYRNQSGVCVEECKYGYYMIDNNRDNSNRDNVNVNVNVNNNVIDIINNIINGKDIMKQKQR